MAMAVGGGEGQSYSDINMTPLIDVMLVLLIIFIITIPSMTHAVKIDNPLPPPPNFVPPPHLAELYQPGSGEVASTGSAHLGR
jgi:biopolymer transport protein ExbD